MNTQDQNTLWERLEGVRQSYKFRPVAIKDMDGRDTTLDRLINRYQIEWNDYLETNPSGVTEKLAAQYAFANKALAHAIATYAISNEGRDISGREGYSIRGTVVQVVPARKKPFNYMPIIIALVAIVGTVGILQTQRKRTI
jgi:hypothetical protein